MTVTANVFPVNIENFGQVGPEVTNRPIGYWFAQTQVTGDASGGSVIVNFILASGADTFPFKGRSPLGVLLSIEEMRGFTNYTAGAVSIDKQLYYGGNILTALKVSGVLQNGAPSTALGTCANETQNIPKTPYEYLFICSPGSTTNVSYGWSTNQNGSIYNCFVRGFVWDRKALLELGGPEKPQGY